MQAVPVGREQRIETILAATKICSKCGKSKPLTAEYWLPRVNSKDGFRGACRVCWYKQQRPNKRRHYWRNRDRLIEEQRLRREQFPERKQLADLVYYWKNKEERNQKSREYYWRNRERILAQKASKAHERPLTLDYGWEDDLAHDELPFKQWNQREIVKTQIDALLVQLDADSIEMVEAFLAGEVRLEDISEVVEKIRTNLD